MASLYYKNLEKRLRLLRKAFLPSKFSETGNYNENTYEKARAYKVLSHSEFEYYFEEIACAIAKKAIDEWKVHKKASIVLVALVSYYDGDFNPVPEQKEGNNSSEGLKEKIGIAFTSYCKKVRAHNHGIKEKNILQLFLPISLLAEDFDNNFLIALNNYGNSRGQIAHSTRAQQTLDPKDALWSTDELVSYVKDLDKKLIKFL